MSFLVMALYFLTPTPLAPPAQAASKQWVYIGTYTDKGGRGIYRLEFDPKAETLSELVLAAELKNPSFLAISPDHSHLYAVSEVMEFGQKPTGSVASFTLDRTSGALKKINEQPSGGTAPCHLTIDREGKAILLANYGGGSVAALPVRPDGGLEPFSTLIQHKGSSVDPSRQGEPHAHSINLDRTGRYALAADLGLDQVLIYELHKSPVKLTPHIPASVRVAPGSGPRHLSLHPSNRFAYVINEIKSTITAFTFDTSKGTLEEIQTISTLPKDHPGRSYTSEIVVHPSGKWLLGSNRGHDSLARFEIDPETGRLTFLGTTSTGGKTPRNFAFDPSGRFVFAANQDSDTIKVFRFDDKTGGLTSTSLSARISMPVCVRFVGRPE